MKLERFDDVSIARLMVRVLTHFNERYGKNIDLHKPPGFHRQNKIIAKVALEYTKRLAEKPTFRAIAQMAFNASHTSSMN